MINQPTLELGNFISSIKYEDIPEDVVLKAKYLFLDYLGGMLPGNKEEMAKILYDFVIEVSGPPESTILGMNTKVGASWAGLYNGAVGHLIDMDDIHWPSVTHAGVCIWSAALAMSEKLHSSGKEFLTAAIVGYEVALRIGLAVEPDHYVRGFNPSGTIMTFGSAAVAAYLLHLDSIASTHAIGLAGVMAAGNRAHLTERCMTKDYNSGFSSQSGLIAAMLAAKRFTASTDELENPLGFLNVYGDRTYPNELTDGLFTKWHILNTAQKLYPACRASHSSIDAILAIRERIKPNNISKISSKIFATGANIVDDKIPWEGSKGLMGPRFSAQFNMAVALLFGMDGLWNLYNVDKVQEYLRNNDIQAISKKIDLIYEKSWDSDTNKYSWCEVVVDLVDGEKIIKDLKNSVGDPEMPISSEDQKIRFRKLVSQCGWSEEKAVKVIALVMDLPTLTFIDDLVENLLTNK